jgi:hypothetical protein
MTTDRRKSLVLPIPETISTAIPIDPISIQSKVSGLYGWSAGTGSQAQISRRFPSLTTTSSPEIALKPELPQHEAWRALPPWLFQREELRLDVDGWYPQMTASGALFSGISVRINWIASLKPIGPNEWAGEIWYKDGDSAALPQTTVTIVALPHLLPAQRKAVVTFSGAGVASRAATYDYKSGYFHPVEFEFDTVVGATAVTSISTHDHPNRPATLPSESLSLERVYRRAGFNVVRAADGTVPIEIAGSDGVWSNSEMHDAMQTYWSRAGDKPQWAMWVLFAALHEDGASLGGIMFDDIGPNHRQATAIFSDSFISVAPPGDATPAAWIARMRFWTAAHEMGHAFNLAHSWQKHHDPRWGTPWIPLTNDEEARSFMNYPYNVQGGQAGFFADFDFRFIDEELLFMRHAPERFVQMGNADWFDNHAFSQAKVWAEPTFKLDARVNRSQAVFEFLEPVSIELKLTNQSRQVQLVDEKILEGDHDTLVILKKDGKPARQWMPFATACREPRVRALTPGDSMYELLFVSAGLNGWDLAEPGNYTIQVMIRRDNEDLVSDPMRIQVKPPRGYEEEDLAQDFFSNNVGRVLAFDGTRAEVLGDANDVLKETAERLPDRKVAVHARVALLMPELSEHKVLGLEGGKAVARGSKESPEGAELLDQTLMERPHVAAETLGHLDYSYYMERFGNRMSKVGNHSAATRAKDVLVSTLAARGVPDKVLAELAGEVPVLL